MDNRQRLIVALILWYYLECQTQLNLAALMWYSTFLLHYSDDFEQMRISDWWVRPRSIHWRQVFLPSAILFIEFEFQKSFRMTRASVEALHTLLQPHIS